VTREQLDAIRARLDAATPGAWSVAFVTLTAPDLRALLDEVDRAFDALQPSLGTPVPPERRIRRQADVDAAFARGAEAMRTAAVEVASKRADLPKHSDLDSAWCRSAECILDELRHLLVPEDKP
jgi:hypothetical protein